jgi:hypothetical protein
VLTIGPSGRALVSKLDWGEAIMDFPEDLDSDAIDSWFKRRLEKALDDFDDCMDKAADRQDEEEKCFDRFKKRKENLKKRCLKALSV